MRGREGRRERGAESKRREDCQKCRRRREDENMERGGRVEEDIRGRRKGDEL